MTRRPWTTFERALAVEMRGQDATNAEIGAELGRSPACVSKFLVRQGLNRSASDLNRDAMLRQAYPMRLRGMTLRAAAAEVGWPASLEAFRQALEVYRRRIGRGAA